MAFPPIRRIHRRLGTLYCRRTNATHTWTSLRAFIEYFLAHKQRVGANWKSNNCSAYTSLIPLQSEALEPLDDNPRFTVPVVFAADDAYVPMLTTTIYSVLSNANTERRYDVIVLERDITAENKQTMLTFFEQFTNATIRFYDVSRIIAGYD